MKMKHILIPFLTLLVALIPLAGCQEATEPVPQTADTTYQARIAELEAQLQKEREERSAAGAACDAQIKALQNRIDALEAKSPEAVLPETEEELSFSYRVVDGKALITAYTGSGSLVTVPATLDGYTVVAIDERAFEFKSVVAVILPDGLEAVGWFAFYGCESLLTITVPSTVRSIGYGAFDGCSHVAIACESDSYAAQYASSYGLAQISK